MIANSDLFPNNLDLRSIRSWWHSIIRERGKFPLYAFVLALPSDQAVVSYLSEYGEELDYISGDSCLIIALNRNKFRRSGLDEELRPLDGGLNIDYWRQLIKAIGSKGYSVLIAKHFDIDFTEFPCMVIFQDIRSPGHVLISLSGMEVHEIADRMKTIFSLIRKSALENKPLLIELEKLRVKETFQSEGKQLISSIRSIAGKTFETAIEVWLKSLGSKDLS